MLERRLLLTGENARGQRAEIVLSSTPLDDIDGMAFDLAVRGIEMIYDIEARRFNIGVELMDDDDNTFSDDEMVGLRSLFAYYVIELVNNPIH